MWSRANCSITERLYHTAREADRQMLLMPASFDPGKQPTRGSTPISTHMFVKKLRFTSDFVSVMFLI